MSTPTLEDYARWLAGKGVKPGDVRDAIRFLRCQASQPAARMLLRVIADRPDGVRLLRETLQEAEAGLIGMSTVFEPPQDTTNGD